MIKELTAWQFREGEFNWLYYAMGLNISGTKQDDFIGRKTFLNIKNKVESKLKADAKVENLSYDVITKDKFYLTSILSSSTIPCIKNIALYSNSKLVFQDGSLGSLIDLKKTGDVFVLKNITLEASEGFLNCEFVNNKLKINQKIFDFGDVSKLLGNSVWVVQKRHYSHEAIQKINSSALNTTRIVTILNGNEPEYLAGFQGFATNNADTDSWSKGSVYVGIQPEKNLLKEFGYTSPSDNRAGVLTAHPDTNIRFKDYPLPYLNEAVELCKRAHRLFYFNFIIGWDVAITNDGPFILEANEKPGMNVAQCIDGGLRRKILEYANKYC